MTSRIGLPRLPRDEVARRREIGQDVRESALAALVGLPTRQAQDIVACLVPSKRRGEERWFWWRDIEGFLDGEQLSAARKALRARRMKPHGSKYWVAGYPRLVAQWHPTKNGGLLPDEVTYGAQIKVWWKCPHGPDHEWRTSAGDAASGHGCPFCCNQKVSVTNSLAMRFPDIAAQWHRSRNRTLTPNDVVFGSARRVWWQCPVSSDHQWRSQPRHRTGPKGQGCPFCLGRRPSSTNSLAKLAPAVAREWHEHKNGALTPHDVTRGSKRIVWWRCPSEPTHEWSASIKSRAGAGRGCPFCTNRLVSTSNCLATTHPELAQQWDRVRNRGVTPRDVTAGSKRRIWWRCARDGAHAWSATVNNRTSNATGCPFCAGRRADGSNCVATVAPKIAAEWHPRRNGDLAPSDVTRGSQRLVWWLCPRDRRHEWTARVTDRVRGVGCPFCAGQRVSPTNSLAARFPDLAKEWHPRLNAMKPSEVTYGSKWPVTWQCVKDPRHRWVATINQRTANGSRCPLCVGARRARSVPRAAAGP